MDDTSHPDPTTTDHPSDPHAAPASARRARSGWPWRGAGRARHDRLTFDAPRPPESTGAWLHVVSGPSGSSVARGASELAARFLSVGHRVLIVDGSPRLRLHDRFDREVRWGVVECLAGEMPLLGLVQDAGRLGLYLLAHGMPARRTHWAQLGRMLDEARPHFGRLVLALDPDAPAAIGEALAGWHLEGWWSEQGHRKGPASRLADRLGIHLSGLDLEALPEPTLESLDARLWALSTLRVEAAAQSSRAVASAPVTSSIRSATATTLECDARVRERLRFLLWMRRIQTEDQRPDAARVPADASVTPA
jgi:hypothetical protein